MDRAEQAGLGVAIVGHGALLVALTLAAAASRLPIPRTDPIEVSFFDEAGPTSSAPTPSVAPPAPSVALELGRPEEAATPPAEPVAPRAPAPVPTPAPAPSRKAEPPAVKAPPARPSRPPAQTAKAEPPRGSRLGKDFLKGIGAEASASRSNAPAAAEAGPEVRAALAALVRRQLKPHWKAPTGADAELLRTELSIALARDGSVVEVEVLRTTGQTPSNRPQVSLHQEQAIRAVRLAAPFRLPPEYYDSWKLLSPIGFDKRLSQ